MAKSPTGAKMSPTKDMYWFAHGGELLPDKCHSSKSIVMVGDQEDETSGQEQNGSPSRKPLQDRKVFSDETKSAAFIKDPAAPPLDGRENSPVLSQREREDRVQMNLERQDDEKQQRLNETKRSQTQKVLEETDDDKKKRIGSSRVREEKRIAVEGRKKQIMETEQEKNEAIIKKNIERDAALEARRNAQRSNLSFAFGSSLPRNLNLDVPTIYQGSDLDRNKRRPTSSYSLSQKTEEKEKFAQRLNGTSSQDTKMNSTSCVNSVARRNLFGDSCVDGHGSLSNSSQSDSEPHVRKSARYPSNWLIGSGAVVADDTMSQSMTSPTSVSRGRRKTDLTPTIPYDRTGPPRTTTPSASSSKRSVSMSRLDQLAQPRRHYVEAHRESVKTNSASSSARKDVQRSPSRPRSSMSAASEQSGGSNRVSSTTPVNLRPRSAPRKPRPVSIAGTVPDRKSFPESKRQIRPSRTPEKKNEVSNSYQKAPVANLTKSPRPKSASSERSGHKLPTTRSTVFKSAHSVKPSTAQKQVAPTVTSPTSVTSTNIAEEDKSKVSVGSPTRSVSPDIEASNINTGDDKSPGKRIISEEEARTALAERRRLAREQAEKEAELERQRQEELRRQEEEKLRREEEEQRRMEEEQLRLIEEHRRHEEEKLKKAIEEQERREEEEKLKREEEARLKSEKEEQEKKAREEAERQRIELEEKLKKEEVERAERKKRLEKIMSRTRGKTGASSSSSQSGSDQPDSLGSQPEVVSSENNSLDSNIASELPCGTSLLENSQISSLNENESLSSHQLKDPPDSSVSSNNNQIMMASSNENPFDNNDMIAHSSENPSLDSNQMIIPSAESSLDSNQMMVPSSESISLDSNQMMNPSGENSLDSNQMMFPSGENSLDSNQMAVCSSENTSIDSNQMIPSSENVSLDSNQLMIPSSEISSLDSNQMMLPSSENSLDSNQMMLPSSETVSLDSTQVIAPGNEILSVDGNDLTTTNENISVDIAKTIASIEKISLDSSEAIAESSENVSDSVDAKQLSFVDHNMPLDTLSKENILADNLTVTPNLNTIVSNEDSSFDDNLIISNTSDNVISDSLIVASANEEVLNSNQTDELSGESNSFDSVKPFAPSSENAYRHIDMSVLPSDGISVDSCCLVEPLAESIPSSEPAKDPSTDSFYQTKENKADVAEIKVTPVSQIEALSSYTASVDNSKMLNPFEDNSVLDSKTEEYDKVTEYQETKNGIGKEFKDISSESIKTKINIPSQMPDFYENIVDVKIDDKEKCDGELGKMSQDNNQKEADTNIVQNSIIMENITQSPSEELEDVVSEKEIRLMESDSSTMDGEVSNEHKVEDDKMESSMLLLGFNYPSANGEKETSGENEVHCSSPLSMLDTTDIMSSVNKSEKSSSKVDELDLNESYSIHSSEFGLRSESNQNTFDIAPVVESEDSSLDSNLSQIMNYVGENLVPEDSVSLDTLREITDNGHPLNSGALQMKNNNEIHFISSDSQKQQQCDSDYFPKSNGYAAHLNDGLTNGTRADPDSSKVDLIEQMVPTHNLQHIGQLLDYGVNSTTILSSVDNHTISGIDNADDVNFNRLSNNPFLETEESNRVPANPFLTQEDNKQQTSVTADLLT